MSTERYLAVAILAAGLLAGCATATPGSRRMLGSVDYGQAFAAAKDVLGQYNFQIDTADPAAGVIVTRPKMVDIPGNLVTRPQARQIVTIRLHREDGAVSAQCSVAEQRQVVGAVRTEYPVANYSSVPDDTPAQTTAATTADQNESWHRERYNPDMERKILADLYTRFHPSAAPMPTTLPATAPATRPAALPPP